MREESSRKEQDFRGRVIVKDYTKLVEREE